MPKDKIGDERKRKFDEGEIDKVGGQKGLVHLFFEMISLLKQIRDNTRVKK